MDFIKIKLLNEDAKVPQRGSEFSVGYDLQTCEEYILEPHSHKLLSTGIALEFLLDNFKEGEMMYARIAPRSGLSSKKKTHVGAGVIDPDYRGEIKVLIFNFSDEHIHIQKGDKVAQIIFEKCGLPKLMLVDELNKTERGENGFGSTGN